MFGKAAKTQELLRELLRDVNCPTIVFPLDSKRVNDSAFNDLDALREKFPKTIPALISTEAKSTRTIRN